MPFYHFTDPRNLPSIRDHGLLCWPALQQRGITFYPASNDLSRFLDREKGTSGYVKLCTQPWHPMATRALREGRVIDLVWLEIDDAVVHWGSTRFSDTNVTANRATIDACPDTALESDDPQAEILIRHSLGPRWITFPDGQRMVPASGHPGAGQRTTDPILAIWEKIKAFFSQ